MVDFLTIGTAISVTQEARTVLGPSSLGGTSRVNALELDNNLRPGVFEEARIVLSSADARTGLALAVTAGTGIIAALKALKSSADLAQRESIVSTLTDLEIAGTRISRLNLHSDTNRALIQLDQLVAETELNNANFISSLGGNIVVSTSKFGGTVRIAPQPLDTTGLNLRSISLLTQSGAEDASSRIATAINTAQRRVDGLSTLQQAINTGDFTGASLDGLISSISGSGLPLGTLVNVVG